MSVVTSENPYTAMQRHQYERDAEMMNQQNHMFHNANQDYWDILVSDTEMNYREKVGLDFGCGCGRNIQNLWPRFKRMDGVDISQNNLKHAEENILKSGCSKERFKLYHCNGIDLAPIPSDEYNFIMSTIVLQHIAVHDIRFNYFKEFFRLLKDGGLLSFQMGFGEGYGKARYYENHYEAEGTNSMHDTRVSDPQQIIDDLTKVGFTNIEYRIRPPYSDGHPNWIFVKAIKPKTKMNLFVYSDEIDFAALATRPVSYQAAQFYHLQKYSNALYSKDHSQSKNCDAVLIFDEYTLLTDDNLKSLSIPDDQLLVYISHDFWCHPLQVAQKLKTVKNVLMILRHHSAKLLFDSLLPNIPKFVLRPGVETSIFNPTNSPKEYDILLGGSETPDYPLRIKLNKVVRENAKKKNWKVLDLTSVGVLSNPLGPQHEYSKALALSKVSPTSSNRGGTQGGKLAIQYFDNSLARINVQEDFYGLKYPEISVQSLATAGITPRYLESLASKSLLIADLPTEDYQEWYQNKMVQVSCDLSEEKLVEILDYWVKNDEQRERICEYAYNETARSESSSLKALELSNIINRHISALK